MKDMISNAGATGQGVNDVKEKWVDLHCFAEGKGQLHGQSCNQEHDRFLQAGEEMK